MKTVYSAQKTFHINVTPRTKLERSNVYNPPCQPEMQIKFSICISNFEITITSWVQACYLKCTLHTAMRSFECDAAEFLYFKVFLFHHCGSTTRVGSAKNNSTFQRSAFIRISIISHEHSFTSACNDHMLKICDDGVGAFACMQHWCYLFSDKNCDALNRE